MKRRLFLVLFAGLSVPSFQIAQCPPSGIVLSNQSEVNNFVATYPNCTKISGFFQLGLPSGSSNISDISGLDDLVHITGNFSVLNCPSLSSLTGLANLDTIGGSITIQNNAGLSSLRALDGLNYIGGGLDLINNVALTALSGLNNIDSLGGILRFQDNASLETVSGLNNLYKVGNFITISNNAALTSLSGLGNLTYAGGNLRIQNNAVLSSIDGLAGLLAINGGIWILNNPQLSSLSGLDNIGHTTIANSNIQTNALLSLCDVPSICSYLSVPSNPTTISGNATGCASRPIVEAACNAIPPNCTNLTSPFNTATNVPITAALTWAASTGYKLTAGTTPGAGDILNNFDVGNITTYNAGVLPCGETIYVTITPYNGYGDTTGCAEESFSTVSCPQNLVVNLYPIPIGIYQSAFAIISNGIVASNTTVVFNAGNNIVLDPAFLVELAGIFSANIDPNVNFVPGNQTENVKGKPSDGKSGSDMDFDVIPAKRDSTKHYLIANLELPDDASVTLSVLDSNGDTISQTQPNLFLTKGQSHFLIDLPDGIPPGKYFVWMDYGSQQIMKKLVLLN